MIIYLFISCIDFLPRLAERREILIFPRTEGNTGNSRELLGNRLLTNEKSMNIFINSLQLYF